MYVYDPSNDTGGDYWPGMVKSILACALIGEMTVTAVLAIKQGTGQAPLMVPAMVITVLFGRQVPLQIESCIFEARHEPIHFTSFPRRHSIFIIAFLG